MLTSNYCRLRCPPSIFPDCNWQPIIPDPGIVNSRNYLSWSTHGHCPMHPSLAKPQTTVCVKSPVSIIFDFKLVFRIEPHENTDTAMMFIPLCYWKLMWQSNWRKSWQITASRNPSEDCRHYSRPQPWKHNISWFASTVCTQDDHSICRHAIKPRYSDMVGNFTLSLV